MGNVVPWYCHEKMRCYWSEDLTVVIFGHVVEDDYAPRSWYCSKCLDSASSYENGPYGLFRGWPWHVTCRELLEQEFADKSSDLHSLFPFSFYLSNVLPHLKTWNWFRYFHVFDFEGLWWSKFGFGLSSKSCFVTTEDRPGPLGWLRVGLCVTVIWVVYFIVFCKVADVYLAFLITNSARLFQCVWSFLSFWCTM